MNVAAVIVTRGDHNLDIRDRIFPSLPEDWDVLVWDNGGKSIWWRDPAGAFGVTGQDLSVYGRYAAIQHTTADLIYVQDDDCVVSDPQAIVDGFIQKSPWLKEQQWFEGVVCNMPPEFRHDFYEDHALVGFGAVFHRDAPARAFRQFAGAGPTDDWWMTELFMRTCDIVFTGLTPRVLVDVPVESLPYAYDYTRMYRQSEHLAERARMRDLVQAVREEG